MRQAISCIAAVGFLVALATHAHAAEPRSRVIWTDKPVVLDQENPRANRNRWGSQVLPIGNGRLGATAWGDVKTETLNLNEDSLWVGNEHNTGAYQPFADLLVTLDHEQYTDYRRELDISRAVQTITYNSGDVTYRREYFASYPAQVLVFRFSADKKGALQGQVELKPRDGAAVSAAGHTITMVGDTSKARFWASHMASDKRRLAGREYTDPNIIKLDYEGQVRVLQDGGRMKVVENMIVFEGCDTVTLLVAMDTNYLNQRDKGWTGEHPHARVSAQIAAAARRSYEALLHEHVADYQQIYGRFELDLGPAPQGVSKLSTPDRIKAYKQTTDPDLEAMVYQYARYLMISCSRPADGLGVMPANLQGLWNVKLFPAWRSDYHTDINLQMNYWFVDQANLSECFEPMAQWVNSIREVRKEETRKVLGVERGWLMRSENGIFGGSTWYFQKGDSAWLCNNLWDHYRFTQDEQYLKTIAYPIMKEISEFWIDHLKALPDGTLAAPKGRSPEQGPTDVDGVSYDQQMCWDLFTNTIEAAAVLGVDAELRKQLTEKRDHLLGPQIGKWGQLQEWMEDIDDPKNQHRHVSHMIAVFPGRQIHPITTPKLAEAAKVSLKARGAGRTGWSKVWRACSFARLQDAEDAYSRINDLIASKTYGNLWMTHPPFQIDANFGYAAAVNEMIAQSHTDVIHLLAALPEAWPSGHVSGMNVRSGFEMDMQWHAGKLVQATLRNLSNTQGKCKVRYGDKVKPFNVGKGRTLKLTADSFR